MENRENERKALIKSLQDMDKLIDLFESSVKKEPLEDKTERDFAEVALKLFPDEKESVEEDIRTGMGYKELEAESSACSRCGLCKTRTNVVFGEGCSSRPDVMVIGEGPGENEDLSGHPFVGAAGQYLDKWLASISLSRTSNCYIANVVKCRPPQNRDPLDEEINACAPFLKQQIELVNPRAVLCLGKPASRFITGLESATMGEMRGRLYFYGTTPVFCTYHPAAVLRNMELKVSVWEDLKRIASFLNLEVHGAKK